jgi:hypothetical protein
MDDEPDAVAALVILGSVVGLLWLAWGVWYA